MCLSKLTIYPSLMESFLTKRDYNNRMSIVTKLAGFLSVKTCRLQLLLILQGLSYLFNFFYFQFDITLQAKKLATTCI